MVLLLILFCLILGDLTLSRGVLENRKFKTIVKWSDISEIIIPENLFIL